MPTDPTQQQPGSAKGVSTITPRSKQQLKVGIIGCGGIARGAHIPGYQQLDEVALVAFCDIDAARAQKAADQHGTDGARSFTSVEEMFAAVKLDAVSVCTPNFDHAPSAITAMRHGAHVLTEKPLAHTSEDARKMVAVARETGRILTVGYQSRFGADAQYLRRLIDAGELGDIYFARARAIRRRGVPTWGVFLNKELQGGGPLIDIGTHVLDLTLWLMGHPRPTHVSGSVFHKLKHQYDWNRWGPWDPDEFEVEDAACAHIAFANGAGVMLESSWALNVAKGYNGTEICGTKGGAELAGGLTLNRIYKGRPVTMDPGGKADVKSQHAKVADFVESILEEREPLVTGEQALMVTEILDAVYRSGAQGEAAAVAWPPA